MIEIGGRTYYQTRLSTTTFGWKINITDEDGSDVVTTHHHNEKAAWEMAVASLKRRGIL